jgi:predicted CXXCH cytochrome family protein
MRRFATANKMKHLWSYPYNVWFFLLLLFLPLSVCGAINSEECLGCHDGFKHFSHGNATCQDCHKDAVSLPHKEKLTKPSCSACHQATAKTHTKSIHRIKKVECKSCHTVHAGDKGKKTCNDCHTKAEHRSLPSREKHLAALTCISCHGNAKTSVIKVKIQAKDGRIIQIGAVDLDGNNTIDAGEWDNLQALLGKNVKDKYSISKDYRADGDIHGVMKKPQACKTCHTERRLFNQAGLQFNGAVQFEIPVDPSIFIPEIPSIDSYWKTVHGRKGVRCSDCHISQDRIDDCVCIKCHKDIHKVYKHTIHAQKGATQCTHCHNPHRIEAYKELTAKERLAVCSRCHKDYIQKHAWLPNTILHFNHLECSTCHSPEFAKSMVFYLSARKGGQEEILSYENLENLFEKNVRITPLLDKSRDEVIDSRELTNFFSDIRKRHAENVFIGSSIVVTRVYHDYSVKRQKERVCGTCHSETAPFYESMLFILPEKGYHAYIPVKGTILSAIPASVFIDVSLLGEQKATWSDVKGFFLLKPKEFSRYAQELGFKWIDLIGIGLGFVILFFILIHILARLLVKK